MTTAPSKPLPVPDEQSAGYWAAAAEHVLALAARCSHCGRYTLPPGVACPGCLSTTPAYEFVPVSGDGTIRSWTVVHDAFLPSFHDELPFVLVDVELDAQADLRMVGRLVDGPHVELHLGDRVTTVFDDLAPGVAVPAFALVDRA